MVKPFFTKLIVGASIFSIAATSSIAVISALQTAGVIDLTTDTQRRYEGSWYNGDVLVDHQTFIRGQEVVYAGETPTKTDYSGETVYTFIGWDYTGDNIPDVPIVAAYSNFVLHACYLETKMDLLEKIDWEKLLDLLLNSDIDIEALLTNLGLTPEQIAQLLNISSFKVKSSVGGTAAYLRTESFGKYNKTAHGWDDADFYDLNNISSGSINPLQYTANKLSSIKSSVINQYATEATYDFEYVKEGSKYPTIAFESENNQGLSTDSYSLTTIGEDKTYSTRGYGLVPCLEQTVIAGSLIPFSNSAITADEKKYQTYVREHYLDIDETYKQYFLALNNDVVHAQTNNVGNAVQVITDYFTNNFHFTVSHNKFPSNRDPLLYFMQESKEGSSNYFATAMTLYLRSLGYPARYTTGYITPIDTADEWINITPLHAMSWCEVYVDNVGWMNADAAMYLLSAYFLETGLSEEEDSNLDFDDISNTDKTLKSLKCGENTVYEKIGGGTFNYSTDLELVAVFSDNSEEVVEPTSTKPIDISEKRGPYTVKPSASYRYGDDIRYLPAYEVTVKPCQVTELIVENDEYYHEASVINEEDFVISAEFVDGIIRDSSELNLNYLTHTEFPQNQPPGDYIVTFSYEDHWSFDDSIFSVITLPVTVTIHELPKIVKIVPNDVLPTTIYSGKPLDFYQDFTWTVTYDDGTYSNNYTLQPEDIIDPEDALAADKLGVFNVQFQAGEYCEPYDYEFEVKENVLVDIAFREEPIKNYELFNEYLHVDGNQFVVEATYLDGTVKLLETDDLVVEYDETIKTACTETVIVKYSEYFALSDTTIEKTLEYDITVGVVNVKTITSSLLTSPIRVELDSTLDELISSASSKKFYVTYDNNSQESFKLTDSRVQYDGSDINFAQTGIYYLHVSFDFSINVDPYEFDIEVRVCGLDHIIGHFDGVPEKLYTDNTYNTDTWNISATAYIFDGEENSEIEVDKSYENFTVNIESSLSFVAATDFSIEVSYTVGNVTRTDTSPVYSVIQRAVTNTEYFNLEQLNGKKYYYDYDEIYTDLTDNSPVYLHADFNDGTEKDYSTSDGLQFIVESNTQDGNVHTIVGYYTINIYDIDYISNHVTVYGYDATGIELTTSDETPIDYDIYCTSSEYINKTGITAKVLFGDFDSQDISVSLITFSFKTITNRSVGADEIIGTFTYKGETFTDSYTIYYYKPTLNVYIDPDAYLEGQYLSSDSVTATITYEVDESREDSGDYSPIDVSDQVTTGFDYTQPLTAGTYAPTYFYNNEYNSLSASDEIEVYKFKELQVNIDDFKTEYLRGDEADDYEKIVVKAVYESTLDSTKLWTIDVSYGATGEKGKWHNASALDLSSVGNKSFNITYTAYNGATHSYTINYTVTEPSVVSVVADVSTSNCTSIYNNLFEEDGTSYGSFDLTGGTITITYENGYVETIIYDPNETYDFFTLEVIDNESFLEEQNPSAQINQNIYFAYTHQVNGQPEVANSNTISLVVHENKVKALEMSYNSNFKNVLFTNFEGGTDEEYDNSEVTAKFTLENGKYYYLTDYTEIIKYLDEEKPEFDLGLNSVNYTVKDGYRANGYIPEDTIEVTYKKDYIHSDMALDYQCQLKGQQSTSSNFDDNLNIVSGINTYSIDYLYAYYHYDSYATRNPYSVGDQYLLYKTELTVLSEPDFDTVGTTKLEVESSTISDLSGSKTFIVHEVSDEVYGIKAKYLNTEYTGGSTIGAIAKGDSAALQTMMDSIEIYYYGDYEHTTPLDSSEYTITNVGDINASGQHYLIIKEIAHNFTLHLYYDVGNDSFALLDIGWGGYIMPGSSVVTRDFVLGTSITAQQLKENSQYYANFTTGTRYFTYSDLGTALSIPDREETFTPNKIICQEDLIFNKIGQSYSFTMYMSYTFNGKKSNKSVGNSYNVIQAS